jgi:hypothetical protein
MGKLLSKFVFQPPRFIKPPDRNDIVLTTPHESRISVKIINRYARFYLIVSHGNAEDINSAYDWASNIFIQFVNVNVVLYGNQYLKLEYTGYGLNEEGLQCSEEYTYNDIECVYKYLTVQMNITPENIVLYGRSLGSGPSCYLAEKYRVGG